MALAQYYKTIGDESRLRILNILGGGMFSVQELTSLLSISQPTVSHHLKTLSQDGFLKSSRDGTRIFYSLQSESDNALLQQVTQSALTACSKASESESDSVFKKDIAQVQKLIEKRRTQTKQYFDKIAKDWTSVRGAAFGGESFLDTVVEQFSSSDCILELGCGTGALFDLILPRSGKTIGVDYSESMLEECRQSLGSRGHSCDLRLGYMEHLPVADDSVDAVVAYMSLHHVPNPRAVLQEARRVLKTSGKLIIVDLVAHEDERMREQFADVWLGFEPKDMQKWLAALNYKSSNSKILGKAKNVFLLTSIK